MNIIGNGSKDGYISLVWNGKAMGTTDFTINSNIAVECGSITILDKKLPIIKDFEIDKNVPSKVVFARTAFNKKWDKMEVFNLYERYNKNWWYTIKLERVEIFDSENWIELNSGSFMFNNYGKYQSGLTFLCPDIDGVKYKKIDKSNLNLPEGDYEFILGDYFVSEKGTMCFRIKKNGKHILLRDSWGGSFNNYRGRSLKSKKEDEKCLFFNRASSNGGGTGYDYGIYPKDWSYTLLEEDI